MTAIDDSDLRLLTDLEPVVAGELDRHLSVAKDWHPHEYVPWSEGRTFDGVLGGQAWSPSDSAVPDAARTALVVNLLTEDNLPSYHHEIATLFGRDGAWGTWVNRWTAEEGRHGAAIRDYLTVARVVDPRALEEDRMAQMSVGFSSGHPGAIHGLAYVSFQELATRIAHRNTGAASQDPVCEQLLTRIALDENLHMLFYRNLLDAAFTLQPDTTMAAVTSVVENFQMPGAGMPGFQRRSALIALSGIYDLRQHHDQVLIPVLRQWKVFERTDLGPAGEKSRDELAAFLAELDAAASRFDERRAAREARVAARGDVAPAPPLPAAQ